MRRSTAPALRIVPALILMARPSQVALVMLVYVTGVLLGAWRGGDVLPAAMLGLVLLLPAALATHWANEAADAETDARSVRTPFSGGSGALLRSGLDPTLPMGLAFVLAALTALATVIAVALDALPFLAGTLLLGGLAGGLAYSVPPVAAMRHGWGEALNALLGALLLPLFGVAAVRGAIEPLDILAFLPFTAVTLCSVWATAWPDRDADSATGKRTLQVRWPAVRLRRVHAAVSLAWAAAIALVVAADAVPFAATGWLVAPLVLLGHRWYTRDRSPWPSVAAMVSQVALVATGLLVALA